jgi:hypothetical protein
MIEAFFRPIEQTAAASHNLPNRNPRNGEVEQSHV